MSVNPLPRTESATALIADDHGLYRTGLGLLLRDSLSFTEVLEVGRFDEALDVLASRPDVRLALFDLTMPGMGGPESLAVVQQTYPSLLVAIISGSENRDDVTRAVSTGLSGFIPKSLADDEIVEAIRSVLENRVYIPRMTVSGVTPSAAPGPMRSSDTVADAARSMHNLTPRQRDVLGCVARGLSNKEIARELDIAEGTVKIHLAALFSHFGVRNRTELATRVHTLAHPLAAKD
jgi:DNA-binding NarL/FixJ family response regulator